jgi:DNA-binding transcriptional LysR family regulator
MILDLASLQTLLAIVELDGFGKAAQRLHRTPGAISLQIKTLEEKLGVALFRKTGRQQTLTEAGELLVGYARRLLQLNEEAVLALQAQGEYLGGKVRFGMPQDFADSWLQPTLAQFSRAHPAVRIDIKVERSGTLLTHLQSGELDLVLAFGEASTAASQVLARVPLRWIAAPDFTIAPTDPVPLLLLEEPCGFRQTAIDALDRARRPWRIVLTSESVSGIWAAARAGLGVAARSTVHMPAGLAVVDETLKLPALKTVPVSLHRASLASAPAVTHLHTVVEDGARHRLSVL